MAKQHELEALQQWVGQEIDGDSDAVVGELFGDRTDMPDLKKASESDALALLRNKFLAQDREWLQAEAKRDPLQFMELTSKLGVVQG